jgi:acetyl esterase/lipase
MAEGHMADRYAPGLADAVAGIVADDLSDLETTRAEMKARHADQQVNLDGLEQSQFVVPGRDGGPDVAVELLRPAVSASAGDARLPAIFHVHGGGFVMGGPENSRVRMARLARELGVLVVSTTYRLAPEHRYPAALHDVLTSLHWLDDSAVELGVDRERVAIHGISAGAGLAAAAALYVRDHGGPALCFQYLAIPELDDRMTTASMVGATATPNWDNHKNAVSWSAYLGPGVPGTDGVEAYAAPGRAEDLSGLPPAYVSVMEFDPLRDEGMAYASKLLAAGVGVELHLFPGTYHGSSSVLTAPVTQRELAEEVAVLRDALRPPGDK